MATILSVEDNIDTQVLIHRTLSADHTIISSYDLREASEVVKSSELDLLLLDLSLPDGNGMSLINDLCRETQTSQIPIIILSARSDIFSKVACLKAGADDFIVKPFEPEDVIARIESVLRRGPVRTVSKYVTIANLTLDIVQQTAVAKTDGSTVDLQLTPIEFKILLTLNAPFGNSHSRSELHETIWKDTTTSPRNIDTHISKLRKKLEVSEIEIQNKRSEGYYLKFHHQIFKKDKKALSSIESLPHSRVFNQDLNFQKIKC